jgi:four helix bundle protein
MGEIYSYRDLNVWQRGMDIAVNVYSITKSFPSSDMYGITSQLRRSAVSVPSNIAEGHARPRREFARFLSIARGSLNELETQLEISCRIGYLPEQNFKELVAELSVIGRQLNALINKMKE